MRKILFFIFFSLLFAATLISAPFDPTILYLTWHSHPDTSMSIQWVTDKNHVEDYLEFNDGHSWYAVEGYHTRLNLEQSYLVHRVDLSNLNPETKYLFRLAREGKIYKFCTMPSQLTKPLRFVVGGDIYHDEIEYVSEMNQQAAKCNPSFALLGGDIAYANGHRSIWQRIGMSLGMVNEKIVPWLEFLALWKKEMVTSDGCLIPIVPAIGNHDVVGGFDQTPQSAKVFYSLFPGNGYRVLDFGNYMSIVILDSGHTHPIIGNQARWLASTLNTRQEVPHKFALYHVGAYPSIRNFKKEEHAAIRQAWVPLFEKFGVNAAFEHHDHAYKRTHPLRKGKIDANGVIYIGDGGWGVKKPRKPKTQEQRPYLAKSAASRSIINVTIEPEKRSFEAIDEIGNIIDSMRF